MAGLAHIIELKQVERTSREPKDYTTHFRVPLVKHAVIQVILSQVPLRHGRRNELEEHALVCHYNSGEKKYALSQEGSFSLFAPVSLIVGADI